MEEIDWQLAVASILHSLYRIRCAFSGEKPTSTIHDFKQTRKAEILAPVDISKMTPAQIAAKKAEISNKSRSKWGAHLSLRSRKNKVPERRRPPERKK